MTNTNNLYSQIDAEPNNNIESPRPIAAGSLSREDLDVELAKGMNSLREGKGIAADEVDTILAKELDI